MSITITKELAREGELGSSNCLFMFNNVQLNNNFTGPLPKSSKAKDPEVRNFRGKDIFKDGFFHYFLVFLH